MNIVVEIKNTFSKSNAVNKIILVNVGIFILVSLINNVLVLMNENNQILPSFLHFLMLPSSFITFILQPWSMLTYMFLHDGFFHILFNMLWFYWLGNILQEYLGNKKLYQAFFGGGIFGGLFFMLCYNIFPFFNHIISSTYALGASAGVLSVVVATATLLPEYPIQLFLFGTVRLKYIALVSIIIDLLSITGSNSGGHLAHFGGAIFGFLYIKYIYGKIALPNWLENLFTSKTKLKVHYTSRQKSASQNTESSQEDIDMILDKISKSGYDSLSKKEKDILFKASKK
jgi:membrane associated rhomboid family serine protease